MLAASAGREAAVACARERGVPVVPDTDLAPFRRARELDGPAWLLAVAQISPDRYRPLAERAVRQWEPPRRRPTR
ncbi:hypothetical protein ACL02T_30865 [Pseudonocardia sp. RS010]|uniref:hypothetical protein n=1 Tax=Pseudonocardia sp. RS010 TaxID=3385979 RepID=UPI0039A02E10